MAITGDSFYGAPTTAPTGLAADEAAVQFTTDASVPALAQGELVALSYSAQAQTGPNLGGGLMVTVRGRWINATGATQTFPGVQAGVEASFTQQFEALPTKAELLTMFQIMLGDPAATAPPGNAGAFTLANVIAIAKAIPKAPAPDAVL